MRATAAVLLMLTLSSCAMVSGGSRPDYMVFFTERSTALDASASTIIAQAAARANATPGTMVTVYGYTDSAGNAQADVALSQQRAQHVTNALAAAGVARDHIALQGRGQTGVDPGVASRRVEIDVGS